jgi:hypothetical protein
MWSSTFSPSLLPEDTGWERYPFVAGKNSQQRQLNKASLHFILRILRAVSEKKKKKEEVFGSPKSDKTAINNRVSSIGPVFFRMRHKEQDKPIRRTL